MLYAYVRIYNVIQISMYTVLTLRIAAWRGTFAAMYVRF